MRKEQISFNPGRIHQEAERERESRRVEWSGVERRERRSGGEEGRVR